MARNSAKTSWKARIFWHRRESFLKEVKRPRFLLTLAALLLLSYWLGHIWIVEYAGLAGMDTFAAVQPVQAARFSTIVMIDKDAYRDYFRSQSPLPQKALSEVIKKILALKPAVLAIDIDTSSSQFQQMVIPTRSDPKAEIPIIWARDAVVDSTGLKAQPVLGQRNTDPPRWGFALFPRDPDWTVREYPRSFAISGKRWQSFHWEITKSYCLLQKTLEFPNDPCKHLRETLKKMEDSGERSVPIFQSRYQIPEVHLDDIPAEESAATDNPLKDRIVLLGGSYSPCDEHPTPFGPMFGVNLIASAVEAELDPKQSHVVNFVESFALKVMLAFLIAWFHYILRPRYAMIATILFLGSMVLAGSYIVFMINAYRADFLPFLIGIWIEQLYEGAEHAERHSEEQARSR